MKFTICIKCVEYESVERNFHFLDIDECAQQPTICGDQDCLNLQGSYRCQEKCLDGFERDKDGYCIGMKTLNGEIKRNMAPF